MITPVVAVLLVAIIPAVLLLGFLAAMTMVVGALAGIDAADGRLLRG
jgi:hypothetical protein